MRRHLEAGLTMIETEKHHKNILLVDDESAFLHSARKILQDSEFSIDTAETFEDAIDLIDHRQFHIVITDIRLTSVMSQEGFEILKYVKENKTGTKVIVLTGYGSPEIMEKAYDMGASLFLEKPVSANTLRSIIRNQS